MDTPSTHLLPCPCCGEQARINTDLLGKHYPAWRKVRIECQRGCVRTEWEPIQFRHPLDDALAAAIENLRAIWNRRVAAGGYPTLPKGLQPVTLYGAFEYLRELALAGNAHAEVALQAWADLARRHPPTPPEKRGA